MNDNKNNKYKIAFLLPENGLSGGAFVIYEHASRLSKSGHDVYVIFENHDPSNDLPSFINGTFKVLSLHEVNHENEFDLVFATFWKTCFSVGKIVSKKYAYFVQSDERKFYDPSLEAFSSGVKNTYELGSHMFYLTEARWIQNLLQREFNTEAFYVPNGINTQIFNQTGKLLSPKSDNTIRILIEGPGNVPYKRVKEAFEVCNQVRKVHNNIEVWYVTSDGYTEKSWKYEKIFTKVPYERMGDIYRSCDVLLKLSTVEGFFGPPLEMMACGGTCVISNVNGHEEYAQHNYNCLIVDKNSPLNAITELSSLITNSELRKNLKDNAIKTAENFCWDSQHKHFSKSVHEIMELPPKIKFPNLQGISHIIRELENYTIRLKFKSLVFLLLKKVKQKMFYVLKNFKKSHQPRFSSINPTDAPVHDQTSINVNINQPNHNKNKLKIAFVGQEEYFRSCWHDALNDGHISFPIQSGNLSSISNLPEFIKNHNVTTCVIFRPEWMIHYPRVFKEIKEMGIKIIGYSTEPVSQNPHAIIHHPDLVRRFNSLKECLKLPYDLYIHFDKASESFLKKNGFHRNLICHPLPVSRKLFFPEDRSLEFDACFLGRSTLHRERFLSPLKEKTNFVHIAHGFRDEDAREIMNRSRIVVNLHNEDYPNLENRVVQALRCGKTVVSEALSDNFMNEVIHIIKTPEELLQFVQATSVPEKTPFELTAFDIEKLYEIVEGSKN